MTPLRAEGSHDLPSLLTLIRQIFAFMDGRTDPPSSVHDLTPGGIAEQVRTGEVWVIGRPAVACLFLTPKPRSRYLGKLAVAAPHRGKGRARVLVENQATFRAPGLVEVGRTAHPGCNRPISITLRRPVA